MLCECGNKTFVINTRQINEGVHRQRRCAGCRKSFYTLETRFVMQRVMETPKVEPKPKAQPLAEKAAKIHRKRVEARRKNEDRKDRVPSYFIEDEEDF